jgi:hypothetical protein
MHLLHYVNNMACSDRAEIHEECSNSFMTIPASRHSTHLDYLQSPKNKKSLPSLKRWNLFLPSYLLRVSFYRPIFLYTQFRPVHCALCPLHIFLYLGKERIGIVLSLPAHTKRVYHK